MEVVNVVGSSNSEIERYMIHIHLTTRQMIMITVEVKHVT